MAIKDSSLCDAVKNSAFVFVKPHANTPATQKLVREKLVASGCTVLTEIDIDGNTIDKQQLIDQHYYAIGAFLLPVWTSSHTTSLGRHPCFRTIVVVVEILTFVSIPLFPILQHRKRPFCLPRISLSRRTSSKLRLENLGRLF